MEKGVCLAGREESRWGSRVREERCGRARGKRERKVSTE
jgi:hypothetical protein